jgi:NADH-quinone oxidoreductase subunit L
MVVLGASLFVLAVGAAAALAFYSTDGTDALQVRFPGAFGFLESLKTSFDTAYDYYVAKIQQRFALILNFIDVVGLAGVVVRGVGGAAELVSSGLRSLHTGRLGNYVYWFLFGVAVLWAYAAGIL